LLYDKEVSMNRRARLAVGLVTCVAVLALAGAAQAATPARLLEKYQPVTNFTVDEAFRPTTIDTFVADSTLERFDPSCNCFVVVDPDPDPDSLPTSGAGWRLNQQSCSPADGLAGETCYAAAWRSHDAPGTVYGRVVRTDSRIVLQYWFFYYDDFYDYTPTAPDFIWQAHEGDWEVVNVVLDAEEDPLYVGYSQHCLGQRRSWSKTARWRGSHPLVYVAQGSHANYFAAGVHPWNTACLPQSVLDFFRATGLALPNDFSGGPLAVDSGPEAFGGEVTSIQRVTSSSPGWIAFPGTWGELQYLHAALLPVPTQPSGFSPVGPAQHAVWVDPVGTLASWPRG
jgi:hypothetical protein